MENVKVEYSQELMRFIKTVSAEAAEEKTNGIFGKLLQIAGGEREVYEFIAGEGFGITYDEFLEYYKSCKTGLAAVNGKLSDDDLDNVAGGFGLKSAVKFAKKAANKAADAAYNATEYVADNPGAFVAGSGVIGGGIGSAVGAVSGAVIGGVIGNAPGAGIGVAVGTAVGSGTGAVVGSVVGMGAVLAANEITN